MVETFLKSLCLTISPICSHESRKLGILESIATHSSQWSPFGPGGGGGASNSSYRLRMRLSNRGYYEVKEYQAVAHCQKHF